MMSDLFCCHRNASIGVVLLRGGNIRALQKTLIKEPLILESVVSLIKKTFGF